MSRPSGLTYHIIKQNRAWFKKGQPSWNTGTHGLMGPNQYKPEKGTHLSKDTEFKKGQVPWNKDKPYPQIRGENHPQWAGDEVGYSGIHLWLYRVLGQPNLCNRCGATQSKRFMWHNKSGKYLRDKSDWIRLCAKCHAHEHENWKKRWN